MHQGAGLVGILDTKQEAHGAEMGVDGLDEKRKNKYDGDRKQDLQRPAPRSLLEGRGLQGGRGQSLDRQSMYRTFSSWMRANQALSSAASAVVRALIYDWQR